MNACSRPTAGAGTPARSPRDEGLRSRLRDRAQGSLFSCSRRSPIRRSASARCAQSTANGPPPRASVRSMRNGRCRSSSARGASRHLRRAAFSRPPRRSGSSRKRKRGVVADVKAAEAARRARQNARSFGDIADAYRRYLVSEGKATTPPARSSTTSKR